MTTTGRGYQPMVLVAAILGVLVFIGALVAEAAFHTSIDPTEQSFAVTLHNDTAGPVVVKQCADTCTSFHEKDELPPGGSVRVNTSSEGVANWWAVTDSTGQTLGCLPLRYNHKIEWLVVSVSEHSSCPTAAAGSGTNVLAAIAGFAIVLLVVATGIASTVFTTISAHHWITARGLAGAGATATTVLAAVVAFLGGWLIFDFYVVIRAGARLVRRPHRPMPAT